MDASLTKGTRIIVVAAVAQNGVIGRAGEIPWNLPTDLKRFRRITKESGLVVMGGETFRSILKRNGKPLRGRMNIVLSSSLEYNDEEVVIIRSPKELFDFVNRDDMGDVTIVGGESVYRLFAPFADELHLTHIEAEVEGDRLFPFDAFDFPAIWKASTYEERIAAGKDDYASTYRVYRRKNPSFVNQASGREPEQLEAMKRIEEGGYCPFCPENLCQEHSQPILFETDHWTVTNNQWPYQGAKVHILIISKKHAERIGDLPEESGEELYRIARQLERDYDIQGGALAGRFGEPELTGASVRHLHFHFISAFPPSDPRFSPIKFRMSGKTSGR